jgi:hypothetical protein
MGSPSGSSHPTTAVRGTAAGLRDLLDPNDRDRPDTAVILDDPEIVTEEASLEDSVVVQSDEEGDQFKVVNLADDDTRHLEGMGVDFDGNTYYGDVQDDFEGINRIALKRGGGAGNRIGKTLDVNGGTPAEAMVERDEDGHLVDMTLDDEEGFPAHNGGLIEYDNEGDALPRFASAAELRPDVKGREVVVMIQRLAEVDPDYEGNSYWATVFADLEPERQAEVTEQYAQDSDKEPEDFVTELGGDEFVILSPTTEYERTEANIEETGFIKFGGIDRTEATEVQMLNERRLDEGHGSVYIPEQLTVEQALPETVDQADVELDPSEDDWTDDTGVIPAFGAGAEPIEA